MISKCLPKSRVAIIAIAAVLCALPLTLRPSNENKGISFVALSTAKAADMAIAPRSRLVVRRRHVAVYGRVYDAVCDGPYVGGGWNGGTYYGGPFMDLRCYGQLPWGPPPPVSYWWW